ncbi:MAG TPA: sigma-70 family RNA polymerase sigma factor [Verrucomicrobiae bacterium]
MNTKLKRNNAVGLESAGRRPVVFGGPPTTLSAHSAPRRLPGVKRAAAFFGGPPETASEPRALPATEVVPTESLHGDSLTLYLREIGRVKLLTPQEEIALAKRIKRGDKKARDQMITANLRLVVKIAREYQGLGLPLLDLINEGNIGLMKGVQRFDPGKGAKLSSYASWWIKQAIRRALSNQSKTIRLPVHVWTSWRIFAKPK